MGCILLYYKLWIKKEHKYWIVMVKLFVYIEPRRSQKHLNLDSNTFPLEHWSKRCLVSSLLYRSDSVKCNYIHQFDKNPPSPLRIYILYHKRKRLGWFRQFILWTIKIWPRQPARFMFIFSWAKSRENGAINLVDIFKKKHNN